MNNARVRPHSPPVLPDSLAGEVQVVLDVLADACVDLMDVAGAGILLAGRDGELEFSGASNEAMRSLELFELEHQQGPSLDCHRRSATMSDEDLVAASGRWPDFASLALDAGFRSAVAIPLRHDRRAIGVLELVRSDPGALSPHELRAASGLADLAAIAVARTAALRDSRVLTGQLQFALDSRVVIEQAKGIIAERNGVDMDRSFALLRDHARRSNIQLVDVARGVVEEGSRSRL